MFQVTEISQDRGVFLTKRDAPTRKDELLQVPTTLNKLEQTPSQTVKVKKLPKSEDRVFATSELPKIEPIVPIKKEAPPPISSEIQKKVEN